MEVSGESTPALVSLRSIDAAASWTEMAAFQDSVGQLGFEVEERVPGVGGSVFGFEVACLLVGETVAEEPVVERPQPLS